MNLFYKRELLITLLLFFAITITKSQDLDSLINISAYTQESDLQKSLNKGTTVSSAKALSTRETPGIISLITAEEIQNSGARDMIDILRLVPGFDVAQDLEFVMGIGLRGNWANEGKVLVLMDGQPFNELLYQTVAIGNRFPVDAIEQIEIIRGPGSAIYGGSAEYGVINIKTKAAESLNGVAVYGTGGFHANAIGRTNGGLMIAQKGKKISWDASLFKGKGIVSDRNYTDLFQDTTNVNLAKASNADPMNINVGIKTGGFQFRTMYDQFKTSEPYTFISFKNYFADAKYEWKVSDKFSITPQLRYFNQIPWQYGDAKSGADSLKARAVRYYAALSSSYDFSRRVNINLGIIYFKDKATDLLSGDYFLGGNTISFNNFAVFAQGLIKHRLANATIGFRYERNNQYGHAFVPRIALTKKIENFHFKILYSQAFRAPAIENINLAQGGEGKIKPEISNVFELELGYQFTPEMLFSVNAFNILTKNIIVYGGDNSSDGTYKNYPRSGSHGIEMIYNIRKKNWYANLTYSFSNALSGKDIVQTYEVPQTTKQYVGLPIQKITLNTNFYITPKLSFDPTFIYAGKRYAYNSFHTVDSDDDGIPDSDQDGNIIKIPDANKLNPYILMNAYLNYKNLLPGFTGGIGVYDILNQKPSIAQAYNGGYGPIPGRSREYVIKLSYQINFK